MTVRKNSFRMQRKIKTVLPFLCFCMRKSEYYYCYSCYIGYAAGCGIEIKWRKNGARASNICNYDYRNMPFDTHTHTILY